MIESKQLTIMADALQRILQTAKEHPAFDQVLFEAHDLPMLSKVRRDTFDVVMIAIIAQDALKEAGQL